jgi:hypothetical protein
VEWIVLEEVDDGAARLIALRPATGERRLLYRSEHPFPLRPSIHPEGTRIAIDAISRNVLRGEYRARVGIVNLESGGVGWLKQSLDPKWRVGGAVFDPTGQLLAIEGAFGGAPLTELYLLDVSFSGNSAKETIIAGAGNRQGLGTAAPRFLPGGRQLVYLHNDRPDGAWEVHLLDLDRSGDSAFSMEGRAPSVLSLPLTEGALAQVDAGLAFSPDRGRVFFVGQTRSRTRQRLRWTPLDGGGIVDLGREHLRIEEVVIAPGTDLVAYAADGNVYLADAESCAVDLLVRGEPTNSHRGLIFDPELGCLWFTTTDSDGAALRMVDLDTREVREVVSLGAGVSVVHALALPDTPRTRALVRTLPEVAGNVGEATMNQGPDADDDRPTTVTRLAPDLRTDTVPSYDVRGLATAQNRVPDAPEAAEAPPAPPRDQTQVTPTPMHRPAALLPPAPAVRAQPTPTPFPSAEVTPEPARSMPDPAGTSFEVSDSMLDEPPAPPAPEPAVVHTSPAPTAPRPEKARPIPQAPPADPREDFVGWMKSLHGHAAPGDQLRRLTAPEALEDARLRDAARMYLGLQVRKAGTGGDTLTELVNAIGAAGYLRLHEGEAALRQLCERCRERLRASAGLPEVEEHYALAAIRAVRLGQRFDFDEVFEEYESMLSQSAAMLENGGEAAAERVIASFGKMYLDLIAEALDQPVNPLAGAAEARRARDRMTGNLAAVGRSGTLSGLSVPKRSCRSAWHLGSREICRSAWHLGRHLGRREICRSAWHLVENPGLGRRGHRATPDPAARSEHFDPVAHTRGRRRARPGDLAPAPSGGAGPANLTALARRGGRRGRVGSPSGAGRRRGAGGCRTGYRQSALTRLDPGRRRRGRVAASPSACRSVGTPGPCCPAHAEPRRLRPVRSGRGDPHSATRDAARHVAVVLFSRRRGWRRTLAEPPGVSRR